MANKNSLQCYQIHQNVSNIRFEVQCIAVEELIMGSSGTSPVVAFRNLFLAEYSEIFTLSISWN